MDSYNGLYSTNPKLAFMMTLALFSLAGIPPFAGMFSKFFVFMAALKAGSLAAYVVVFVALINTVVSLYYYLLIVKAMYIKSDAQALPYFKSDTNTPGAVPLYGRCAALWCCKLLLGVDQRSRIVKKYLIYIYMRARGFISLGRIVFVLYIVLIFSILGMRF